MYLLIDEDTIQCAAVDPVEPEKVITLVPLSQYVYQGIICKKKKKISSTSIQLMLLFVRYGIYVFSMTFNNISVI